MDHLTDFDRNIADDTTFQILDDLYVAGRNDLAFCTGNFINGRQTGPDDGDDKQDKGIANDKETGPGRIQEKGSQPGRHKPDIFAHRGIWIVRRKNPLFESFQPPFAIVHFSLLRHAVFLQTMPA